MKSIEELKKEQVELEEKLALLWEQREDLIKEIDNIKYSLETIKKQITEYETYQKKEKEKEYRKKILNWITGQAEKTMNIGTYDGIVCPSLNIFKYRGDMPKGSQEEIIALLKEGGNEMLSFSTRFIAGGLWGDDVLNITLHKKI